jgi:hypothetical protein
MHRSRICARDRPAAGFCGRRIPRDGRLCAGPACRACGRTPRRRIRCSRNHAQTLDALNGILQIKNHGSLGLSTHYPHNCMDYSKLRRAKVSRTRLRIFENRRLRGRKSFRNSNMRASTDKRRSQRRTDRPARHPKMVRCRKAALCPTRASERGAFSRYCWGGPTAWNAFAAKNSALIAGYLEPRSITPFSPIHAALRPGDLQTLRAREQSTSATAWPRASGGFASDCRQARWMCAHCHVGEGDGALGLNHFGRPTVRTLLVSGEQRAPLDTWRTVGLCGMASAPLKSTMCSWSRRCDASAARREPTSSRRSLRAMRMPSTGRRSR